MSRKTKKPRKSSRRKASTSFAFRTSYERDKAPLREAVSSRRGNHLQKIREQFEDPDPDFQEFRALLGAVGLKEIEPTAQDESHKRAFLFWLRHPLARRLIEIYGDFIVGNGISAVCESSEIQSHIVDPFWALNCMDEINQKKAGEHRLFGETLIEPTTVNRVTYLNWLDPFLIREVEPLKLQDGKFIFTPGSVLLRQVQVQTASGAIVHTPERVRVIQPHKALKPAQKVGQQKGEPLAFYFRANSITGAMRGHSDLLPLLDYLDVGHNMVFSMAERQLMLTSLLWHARGTNLKKDKQEAILTTIGTARPGTSIYTDKEVEIDAVTPTLGNADMEAGWRTVKNMILGGAGLPEGFFADGAQSNLATLQAQGLPTMRTFVSRQREWSSVIRVIVAEIIERGLREYPELADEPTGFEIRVDPVTQKDQAQAVTAFVTLMGGVGLAVDLDYLTHEEAASMVRTVASQITDEVDTSLPEELKRPAGEPTAEEEVEPEPRAASMEELAASILGDGNA